MLNKASRKNGGGAKGDRAHDPANWLDSAVNIGLWRGRHIAISPFGWLLISIAFLLVATALAVILRLALGSWDGNER